MSKCWLAAAAALLATVFIADTPKASTAPSPPAGCVALTFDDGPDQTLTPQVLAILEKAHVLGTFFVVGQRVRASPEIVQRTLAEGHEIGNHTFDHRLLISLTEAEAIDEIALTDKAVIAATGHRPTLIRPPYGIWGEGIEAALRKHGLMRPIALWDVDSFDWLDDDSKTTLARAGSVASGSIVLMHDIHASTLVALPKILAELSTRNMRLTTVSGLPGCLKSLQTPGVAEVKSAPDNARGRALLGALVEWTRDHGPS